MCPSFFMHLRRRQKQQFKNDRYLAAIPASAIYNVNRSSLDIPVIDPIDFVRERDPKEEKVKEIKAQIKHAVAELPSGTTPEKYQQVRKHIIDTLIANEVRDAEDIFDECWPSLTPNK
jgi:hypothetical protein